MQVSVSPMMKNHGRTIHSDRDAAPTWWCPELDGRENTQGKGLLRSYAERSCESLRAVDRQNLRRSGRQNERHVTSAVPNAPCKRAIRAVAPVHRASWKDV